MSGQRRLETNYVHVGSEPDSSTGSVATPIVLGTTFSQSSLGHPKGASDPNSHGKGYVYSRTGNPTRGALERALAAAERGKFGVAFSSGLAAIHAVCSLLESGQDVICIDDVYGGTQRMFEQILAPQSNLTFQFVPMHDPAVVAKAIQPGKTKLVWIETPTNPNLIVVDISAIANAVHKIDQSIIVCVDNTFMSPFLQQPLNLAADIVVHSITKFIGGHSDVVMGCCVTNNDELAKRLRYVQFSIGSVPSPFDCYLALRGMKTLHLRMSASQDNAQQIAVLLSKHPQVRHLFTSFTFSSLPRRRLKVLGPILQRTSMCHNYFVLLCFPDRLRVSRTPVWNLTPNTNYIRSRPLDPVQ